MPGGGKGPSQSGSVTQTTVNPTQMAQLPFLQSGFNQAQSLDQNNPFQYYPGQTLADFNPAIGGGYQDLVNQYGTTRNLASAGNGIFNGVAGGDMLGASSPAFGGFHDLRESDTNAQQMLSGLAGDLRGAVFGSADPIAHGGTFAQLDMPGQTQGLTDLAGASAGNPYGNLAEQFGAGASRENIATDMLAATARGDYLNSNPYLQAAISAATRPLVRDYQTAVAPTNDSTAEAAGRYGSGFHQNVISDSEQNLAKALGDTAGTMSSANYANERGLQTQAQGTLGSLINQDYGLGIEGATNAGNLYNTGVANSIQARLGAAQTDQQYINSLLGGINAQQNADTAAGQIEAANLGGIEAGANGLQSGYDSGNRNTLIGLGMEPTVIGQNYAPSNEMVSGGQGLTSLAQQQINDAQNRFYGNQQAPWQQAAAYMNLIGNPVGGSSSTNSPILGPSPFSSALGTLGSIGSLGNQFGLFGSGGLLGGGGAGSMFGALGGLGSAGATAGLFGSAAGEAAPFLAGGGADALSSFLPLLAF